MDEQLNTVLLNDAEKTNEQLIDELSDLRLQIERLKSSETDLKQSEKTLKGTLAKYQKRENEITALFQCANLILLKGDFIYTVRTIFESCKNITGATAGYVALLSEEKTENEILFLDSGGLPGTVNPDIPMPVKGLHAEAYHNCNAVYHNDFAESECMKNMAEGHVNFNNVLFAPLVIDGTVSGLIGLANKPEDFNGDDALIAEAFAELAAIALYNNLTVEALKESETRFRSLIQIAPVLIIHLTPDHKIIEFNKKAEDFYGVKREDVLGKDYLKLFLPEEIWNDVALDIKKVLSGEPTRGFENYVITHYGEKRITTWDVDRRLDTNGNPIGIIAIGQDITERKHSEDELRNAQSKIIHQEKMASIGQLAAGVAHEINNPMGFISSNLGTLGKYVPDKRIP